MYDRHGFFFAIRPNPQAGAMALEAARQQIVSHNLLGTPVAVERLHVTLHWLGVYDHVPEELLRRAMHAGGRVEMEPFGVGFDLIGSFEGPEAGGLALTGTHELESLKLLQRTLGSEMKAAGMGPLVRSRFNPHVSLLYNSSPVLGVPIEPIRWWVDELVLIDSHVGKTKHVEIARWPLRSRQMRLSDW